MANTTGNKYGGRTKGTPNKITNELRRTLKHIVDNALGYDVYLAKNKKQVNQAVLSIKERMQDER